MRPVGGWTAAIAVIAAAVLAGGCSNVNYTAAERYDRGLVICLSGAGGGIAGECDRIRDGLASGGVDRAIETFDWSSGGVLSDQSGVEENRKKAHLVARRIEAYLAEHPGRPVHLVGISAGTGVIVWALEDLSEGAEAEGAVLMASSLDTKYDLGPALRHVKTHIYSFNSLADTILSLGVTWAGTVDRRGGIAGGLVGFSPPDGASDETKAIYKEKLTQIGWWPGDMVLGHMGDHLGSTNPTFVRVRIAPLVLGKESAGTNGGAPAETAGEPGNRPQDKKKPDEKPAAGRTATRQDADRAEGRRRFFGWTVGSQRRPSEPQAAKRPKMDESMFLQEAERLP